MRPIKLLIADVDGTLLTPDKRLTDAACRAVDRLREAGIHFTITSGRPPRGMRMLIEPLNLVDPFAAFNGGMFLWRDLSVCEQHPIAPNVAKDVVRTLEQHGLDVWMYRGLEWYVRNCNIPHREFEQWTVQFEPTVVQSFDDVLDAAVKIVGISDNPETMEQAAVALQPFGDRVTAALSQPYYLDVTHKDANKGMVVKHLSRLLNIPYGQIATMGDMPNDVLMFQDSGLSIAMGNAPGEVKEKADFVTASNTEEGFARAVEKLILPQQRESEAERHAQ